jgi:hypothetical protein
MPRNTLVLLGFSDQGSFNVQVNNPNRIRWQLASRARDRSSIGGAFQRRCRSVMGINRELRWRLVEPQACVRITHRNPDEWIESRPSRDGVREQGIECGRRMLTCAYPVAV